jgi:hypothetical protein
MGPSGTVAWLAAEQKLPWGEARREVRTALALEDMPATRDALASGEISGSTVRVLMEAREAHPRAFTADEDDLVQRARESSATQFHREVDRWQAQVRSREQDRDRAERLHARRRLRAFPTTQGMVRVDGELEPEAGEGLLTALGAIQDAWARSGGSPDPRTPEQRRADALGELARNYLDSAGRPNVAGERPHITVTVDLPTLRGLEANGAELEHAGSIAAEVARRLGCDGSIRRVVLGPRSEPLDVGRATPVVPAGLRRAVVARDKTCRFPGCARPPAWTDAHHVVHWADGGRTALSNLVLLCRPHHRLVHEGQVRVGLERGGAVFRRSDGTRLGDGSGDRAPPFG